MKGDACSATPGGVGGVRVGRCTSVTASRMTDAYGAGTRKGCCPQSEKSEKSEKSDKSDKSDKSEVLSKYAKL